MKKKILSIIIICAMCFSTFITPKCVSYARGNEAYQGIFMNGNTFIAVLLSTGGEPGERDGVIYHISKPFLGSYGYVYYDHYGTVGDIKKINGIYYIQNGLFEGEISFGNNNVVLSGTSKSTIVFRGSYTQISNSGANMSPDMIWFKIPEQISVVLRGKEIAFDQPPIMQNDRVMVPMRAIFEALGYDVFWYPYGNGNAYAVNGSDYIDVFIGEHYIDYELNGRESTYYCDVVPAIVNDRTLVPVRAIAECAGCDVKWDGDTQTVIIN